MDSLPEFNEEVDCNISDALAAGVASPRPRDLMDEAMQVDVAKLVPFHADMFKTGDVGREWFFSAAITGSLLEAYASTPGTCFRTAIALNCVSKMLVRCGGKGRKNLDPPQQLKLTKADRERFGLTRRAVRDAYRKLEMLGLLRLHRASGQSTSATLLGPTYYRFSKGYKIFLDGIQISYSDNAAVEKWRSWRFEMFD